MSNPAPRPAATVVLLRESDWGVETFLMRRPGTMKFAPRMYVFPGGRLDDEDAAADAAIGIAPPLQGFVACGIREVHEETGVELVHEADRLILADHWVTPESEFTRFDVRFFLTRMPAGQEATSRSTESDLVTWLSPEAALIEHCAGHLPLLPPTRSMLDWLAGFGSVTEALEGARKRVIRPKLPKARTNQDGSVVWALVDARTGEVLEDDIGAPKLSEVTGKEQ